MMTRDISNNARIQYDRENVNYIVRYNRDKKDRVLSEGRKGRINNKPNRNHETVNSRRYTEKTNERFETLRSWPKKKDRCYESNAIRDVIDYKLGDRRRNIERSLERVNERISFRSLSIKEFDVKNELSRARRIQSITNVSDRVFRHNRKAFTLALDIRERVEARKNLRESRYVIENKLFTERRDLQQTVNRHNDRIRNNNNIRLYENQLRLNEREDPNRAISRTSRTVKIVERVIRISRTNIGNDNDQRLHRVSNERDFTNKRNYTRKTVEDHERRLNKKIQVKKITLKRMTTSTSEKRYSMLEFFERKGFKNHKIQYGNSVFEIKWQYLICALQIIYLCSILMQMRNNNEENKHKNRIFAWLTPMKCLKMD